MKISTCILSRAIISAMVIMMMAAESIAMADTLEQALTGGKISLDVRYRCERVDQDNALKNADATTIRSRLGYATGTFSGVSAYLELENITSVGPQNYNSGGNGRVAYSIVSDPTGSQADQAYLAWEGPSTTLVKLGRQVINLDNQRFVGRVDWRQNGQTFDALSLANKSLRDTVITVAYLGNVDRITAESARMSSELLNAKYTGLAVGDVSTYVYLLDYDQQPNQSARTYGIRLSGDTTVRAEEMISYTFEYAMQSDYASNPNNYDLNYRFAEIGGKWRMVLAKLGYEVLEGDGLYSVQTPLATLHAFNGWADQFLTTPAAGLEDTYLSVGDVVDNVHLLVIYHNFKANKGGSDYGEEWDFQALMEIGKRYLLAAKYAGYNAGIAAGKVDTAKVWLMAQVAF